MEKKEALTLLNGIGYYFIAHGIFYILSPFLIRILGPWSTIFNFMYGNITLTDFFVLTPYILGFFYIMVGFFLLKRRNWARVAVWPLCVQAIFFEFPVGTIISVVILISSFTSSFSKLFSLKIKKTSYQLAGLTLITASIVSFLVMSGIGTGVVSYTMYNVSGYDISYDSPESKIQNIEQTIGMVDVLIELTASPDFAPQQQDLVISEIAQYIKTITTRITETSNALIVTMEASYLLNVAENENVARIHPVEATFEFFPYELSDIDVGSIAPLQLNVNELWDMGYTGEGITIAVMDTGIKEDHPDLQRDGQSVVVGGLHLHGEYVHPHGTMVASCIANQKPGYKGIAPGVNLLNIEVFHWETKGNIRMLTSTNADILQGFEFVANWKELTGDFVILSCSWGVSASSWPHDADVCTEAANRLAIQHNIPVIAAVGNSGPGQLPYVSVPFQVMSPSGAKNVLSVGAVNYGNTIADFSSRGPYYTGLNKPDVVAPGVNVPVLDYTGITTASGTSFACPYVSAVAALLIQENEDISSTQLYDALRNGASDLGVTGYDYEYGYGLVDASSSMSYIKQTISSTETILLVILTGIVGILIVIYPYLNKKLQK